MRATWLLLAVLASALLPSNGAQEPDVPHVAIVEIVADPQTDWTADGRITPSDEFVELYNGGDAPVDLEGWTLLLNDTTPNTLPLWGRLEPGERHAFINPPGDLNLNGHVALRDATGALVDEVRFGAWPGATLPNADATGPTTEALRRVAANWTRGHATPSGPPLEPYLRHTPPFEVNANDSWDPGDRSRALRVEWTDADRAYEYARLELVAGNVSTVRKPAILASGRWSADVPITTPSTDFEYGFVLEDVAGEEWRAPRTFVKIDDVPPQPPLLIVPAWTNTSNLGIQVEPVVDTGVGGVEYAVELNASVAGWTPATAWTSQPDLGVVNLDNASQVSLRAVARDAYGHEARGPEVVVKVDRQAPSAPPNLTGEGYRTVELKWGTPADDGQLDHFRLERTLPGPGKSWTLPSNATRFVDASLKLGEAPTYELRAFDAAGNPSPPTTLTPDLEGLYPHATLRVNQACWGQRELRIHADFDRAMNTSHRPLFAVDHDHGVLALEGRWLANASTYLVELSPATVAFEGHAAIRLRAAVDSRDRPLWREAEQAFCIDRSPPSLEWSDVGGWVGPAGLTLVAHDARDAQAEVRVRLNESDWQTFDVVAHLDVAGPVRIRAYAQDDAAMRSPARDRVLRPDLDPPVLDALTWTNQGPRVRLSDAGAGVNASRVHGVDAAGRWVPVRADGRAWIVETDQPVTLRVTDLVGNEAEVRLEPAAPDGPQVSAADDSPEPAALAPPTWGAPVARTEDPPWMPAGGVGLAMAGLLAAGLARRRRKPAASLAARIRRARASQP